jgi:hypothetical protein
MVTYLPSYAKLDIKYEASQSDPLNLSITTEVAPPPPEVPKIPVELLLLGGVGLLVAILWLKKK